MSTPDFPYSTSSQEGEISANLNASMLLNFMMGIYTVVYAGTMYLYVSKKTANMNRRIVLSAISVMYLLCFTDFILQWYSLNLVVVINGNTRESIFISTVEGGPQWTVAHGTFVFYSSLIVSDGLLIWRCYHIWGKSFRVISVPLILSLAEFSLFVPATVLGILFTDITNDANAILFDNISSALIIHFASRLNGSPSRRLFNHIVVLVIESATAYSLVLLLSAIATVIPSFTAMGSPWEQANYYMQAVLIVVPGLAATVLVARIAVKNPNNTVASTITHISGLEFGSQQGIGRSGNATVGEFHASMQTGDAAPAPVSEVKESSIDGMSFGGGQV